MRRIRCLRCVACVAPHGCACTMRVRACGRACACARAARGTSEEGAPPKPRAAAGGPPVRPVAGEARAEGAGRLCAGRRRDRPEDRERCDSEGGEAETREGGRRSHSAALDAVPWRVAWARVVTAARCVANARERPQALVVRSEDTPLLAAVRVAAAHVVGMPLPGTCGPWQVGSRGSSQIPKRLRSASKYDTANLSWPQSATDSARARARAHAYSRCIRTSVLGALLQVGWSIISVDGEKARSLTASALALRSPCTAHRCTS